MTFVTRNGGRQDEWATGGLASNRADAWQDDVYACKGMVISKYYLDGISLIVYALGLLCVNAQMSLTDART